MRDSDKHEARRKHRTSVRGAISLRAYGRKCCQANTAKILRRKREKEKQNRFIGQFPDPLQPIVRELVAGPMLRREITERFGVSDALVRALATIVNAWGQGVDTTAAVASIR